jgi:hypothetical protein
VVNGANRTEELIQQISSFLIAATQRANTSSTRQFLICKVTEAGSVILVLNFSLFSSFFEISNELSQRFTAVLYEQKI